MVIRQRRARDQIDPALWRRADMRAALAARDIAGVFKLLQRTGVSQRHIAALTAQSQSEISEILAGRQVSSYDLLLRIADGRIVDDERLAEPLLAVPASVPASAEAPA